MNRIAKQAVLAALASVAVTVSLTAVTPTPAYAINTVECNGRKDLLRVLIHEGSHEPVEMCYANAGQSYFRFPNMWITRISTGNNRVQWYGDGRWQPAQPIGKWTVFTWPKHPRGVNFGGLRIL
ncbi:beta/gamma crystallin domain-containing protein [Nonomuraea recticatena]|uniref:Streptomyces killer toxin-like beta/gamma crystallin domain-containing protein n=1 Tax=Nonomuraea recticatena TaxID=46178 RepID=A0ABP6F0S6_9ACTN